MYTIAVIGQLDMTIDLHAWHSCTCSPMLMDMTILRSGLKEECWISYKDGVSSTSHEVAQSDMS